MNKFLVTFDAMSTPKVTELSGTVFATIPSFYFCVFGMSHGDDDCANALRHSTRPHHLARAEG